MFACPPVPDDDRPPTADVSSMRAHNSALVLRMLRRRDATTRAEVSRETGLSRSTVSAIVNELMERGLVSESHVARSRGGRPPVVLRFNADRYLLAGIEMGSRHLTVVITDLDARPLHRQRERFDVMAQPTPTVRRIVELVQAGLRAVDLPSDRLVGVGVGVPCPLHGQRFDRLSPRILPMWQDIGLGMTLHAQLGVPVFVDNDANVGALAEQWWGAGRDGQDFTFIKVATGVGAGHVVHGRLYEGSHGSAGEIGHTTVEVDGRPCRCGLSGCLEAHVGSQAVLDRVAERLKAGESSILLTPPTELRKVMQAAKRGDALSIQVIEESGRYLGIAIANLLNLLNPSRVVLGGRLTSAGPVLLEPLQRALASRAISTNIEPAEVVLSTLGVECVAIGAATLVLRAALDEPSMFPAPRPVPQA